ncbi:hypothetical protein ABT369_03300 [Dactylosporangium sp. NPDC000244]|uniref:hypothetical protein n=1 Tax=Dactylosporangium sp. NPDC000244 TaxID=3154365 RepID=UPI0033247480
MATDYYAEAQTAKQPGKQGFLRFLASLMQPPAVEQPDLEVELSECRTDVPIALAAHGDAFDFSVRPTFTWYAEHMTRSKFENLVDTYMPDALYTLRTRSERVARSYEPHRSRDLERDLNTRLSAKDWAMGQLKERIICRPEVFVLPDPRVRKSMQPYWQRRIEMQTEHELAMRGAELTRERTQAWSRVMAALEADPRNRHAAALVGHEAFAEVFTAMTQGRKDELLKLIDLLEKAGRSFNEIGLYEYAEGLDAALAEYRKRAGMDEAA